MFKFLWPCGLTRAAKMAAVEAENARLTLLLTAYRCMAAVRKSEINELKEQNAHLRSLVDLYRW